MPLKASALPESNTIEFSNCVLGLPGTTLTASAQCGMLEVPENPDQPDGRKISLNIAYAKATSPEVAPDPVFIFAGGPGQAATETWVILRNVLNKVRRNRDIVMIDQRGTGQSNKLDCPRDDDEDLNQELDLDQLRELTRSCLENLDGDPRFYTTTHGMRDYDAVRRAMGFDKINLLGVSYGTRSAQVYLRMFPDTVRTVTLDSVVPMQLALGQEHAPMLDRAVSEVFQDCRADATCSELFRSDENELLALQQALRESPQNIVIVNPTTGEDEEILFTADTLAVAVRFLSYSSESQAVLPLLIHEALTTGDLSRMASQALLVMSGLSEMLARGMELSVMCAEDYPFLDFNDDQGDTIIGNILLDVVRTSCEVWPAGQVPQGFHEPVESDVPVLLVSGQRDPVTPPHYAARVAETFPNSVNLVARGQSHSVLRNVCLRDIATEFIKNGGIEDLDTSCVEDIRPSPFFTSLLGPEP
ncbi:MAG: alpha/beta hydrolase [Xanthomonadales bacterium]|nr:alpha/beta hydrolase [Xanthomonadales bacterium]NNL94633.1 alpha/beta hydrolase [Xanthomonadales bacterium]